MQTQHKYLPYFLLFLVVFVSRLPFLSAGYGVEEDSWGIALAAFHTKMSGVYEPSRFPGHPVQELIYSALWGAGPIVYNGLCAIFSAVAALFFALILQHFNFRHNLLAGLAFAFIPVIYISSTYTIDFMWSEAFVLMSFYFVLKNKLPLAGLLLGLAVGCRVTCGVMLVPYMIILWKPKDLKANFITLCRMAVPMGIVSVLVFLPVILQFGASFFMYYDQFPYPPMTKVLYKMTIGVFGFVGFAAIIVFKLIILLRKNKSDKGQLFLNGISKKMIWASYIIIVLYIISYFRLPQKSGYMLPVIPFVILLFGYYLHSKQFQMLCYAFIISSFVCSINLTDKLRGAEHSFLAFTTTVSGQEIFFDVLSGPAVSDLSKRKQKIKYTAEVMDKALSTKDKTVIISGWWYNEIMVTGIGQPASPAVIFEPYIPESKMKEYIDKGYRITFLPEQNTYNDLMYGMERTDVLAAPF